MAITPTTPLSEVQKELMFFAQRAENLTIRALSYLGEQCVNRVRDRSMAESWNDQTGNLRSSIGYVIAKKGVILGSSDFGVVKKGTDGPKAGRELAEEIARRYTNDYVLVVVAGMHYAEYVEAMENKDVLASTELWAKNQAPKLMQKLIKQIKG